MNSTEEPVNRLTSSYTDKVTHTPAYKETSVRMTVLEERGLIVDVGRWVLNESCREAAVWHNLGHPVSISVNVSMRHLESDQLVDDVRHALAVNELPADMLILEVTESTLMPSRLTSASDQISALTGIRKL